MLKIAMDERQLLHEYVTQSSDEAFRQLVERYGWLVYHAALRQLSDRQVAEEVTQAVFIALAQKAKTLNWPPPADC